MPDYTPIHFIDEPIDVIPSIVSYVGGDFRNVGITDLEAVDQALSQVKDYVQVVPKAQYVDGLANGKYCASIGFSGDVLTAREEAKARGVDPQVVLPGHCLEELAELGPRRPEELWLVRGLGGVRMERYGPTLLRLAR